MSKDDTRKTVFGFPLNFRIYHYDVPCSVCHSKKTGVFQCSKLGFIQDTNFAYGFSFDVRNLNYYSENLSMCSNFTGLTTAKHFSDKQKK